VLRFSLECTLFRQILDAFLARYQFVLPDIFAPPPKYAKAAAA
jgi:hypothetical protein